MRATIVSLVVGLTMTGMSVTQCGQQDTSDWLIVDNRTDSQIVITDALEGGVRQVGGMSPQASGFVGGTDRCSTDILLARLQTIEDAANDRPAVDLPVIDRRPASEGEACTATWVIEAD